MIAAYIALGSFGSLFLLFLLWIIITGLGRARDEGRLSPLITRIGIVISYIGIVWDVLCNLLICTFIFLDIPHEPTLSQRLRRLVLTTGWRSRLAILFAVNLINPFSVDRNDPHIHIPKGL